MLMLHFLLYALQSAGGGSERQEGVDATHIYLNPKPFLTPKPLKVVDPRDKNEWIPQILLPLPSFAERAYTEAGKEKLAVCVCVCVCARARKHAQTNTYNIYIYIYI